MAHTKTVRGYFFVIASAFIFGCMPLGAKFIHAEGVTSLSLVFLRNCMAIPILASLARLQGHSLTIHRNALPKLCLIAVMGCCITPILLYQSYNYLSSGTATVFHFIYPSIVVTGSILFFKEPVQKKVMFCVLLCTAGICLFYTPGNPIHPLGAVFSLLSGVTYAFYVLLLSGFQQNEISGFKFSFYIALICSVVMFFICLITGQLTIPVSFSGWLLCLVFSLSISVGAVVLFQQGTFLIGGQHAAILSTAEPITSLFIGMLVFHETISIRTAAGSFLVILASILIAVFDRQHAD